MTHARPLLTALAALAAVALLGACTGDDPSSHSDDGGLGANEAVAAVVYKSPECDCCGRHAAHLDAAGFDVELVDVDDVVAVKVEQGVPGEVVSCHTAVIDGYVVEGHVPAASIERLLDQRPDIEGIALAGMPAGAPGMGGSKEDALMIRAFADAEVTGTFEVR